MAAPKNFDALTRPSGAFAMLAIDQRESMRAMFGEYQKTPVTDSQLTEFKLAALRALYEAGLLNDNLQPVWLTQRHSRQLGEQFVGGAGG